MKKKRKKIMNKKKMEMIINLRNHTRNIIAIRNIIAKIRKNENY